MTEGVRRALLVVTAVATVLVSVGVAYVLAFAMTTVFVDDSVWFLVATLVASALVVGYLSYREGPRRIRHVLDARPVPREAAPNLHRRLDAICERMGVDRPGVYVTTLEAPNALVVGGRGGGVVLLDHRLARLLGPAELDAILAHELAHLEGYDGLVQTLATSVLQTVAILVFLALLPFGLAAVGVSHVATRLAGGRPAPLPVQLVRAHHAVSQVVVLALLGFTLALRAHSRRRELAADDRAVDVTGDPLALARALRRIQRASDPYSGLWSSLFVHGEEEGTLTRLLATHPPMDDRIERLREMATGDGPAGHRIPVQTA